ncbi:MAG: hypothetical protein WD431_14350 [Cyclobacteriaceae bacterium]
MKNIISISGITESRQIRLRNMLFSMIFTIFLVGPSLAQISAGVAKVDITDREAGEVNDPLFAKALILDDGTTRMVMITLDVVALEGIGPIRQGYLEKVRSQIQDQLGIPPSNVLINASHCHGIVRKDVDQLTVEAVLAASKNMVKVNAGSGSGQENRIMENRRVFLKNGNQVDMRRAYPFPPDEEIAKIGPVDPEIGILRLDRLNGQTLAVIYNFAVHPIQGVPSGGNTADMIGFASKVIEDNMEGTMAFFLQGCGGDINPVSYKGVETPPNAEPLGNMLGLSVLKALKEIPSKKVDKIHLINESMDLPRADFKERIKSMEEKQLELVHSLRGTNINLKTYIGLLAEHNYSEANPSAYAYRYMHEEMIGSCGLRNWDKINKNDMDNYQNNIYIMEELIRLNVNLALIKKHHQQAEGRSMISVEILGANIGGFYLVTFPGELTVQIGLNIKERSPYASTFVAGYTNGYIYYAPTAEQLRNKGAAQEDSETVLAPEWQDLYEKKVVEILRQLK